MSFELPHLTGRHASAHSVQLMADMTMSVQLRASRHRQQPNLATVAAEHGAAFSNHSAAGFASLMELAATALTSCLKIRFRLIL